MRIFLRHRVFWIPLLALAGIAMTAVLGRSFLSERAPLRVPDLSSVSEQAAAAIRRAESKALASPDSADRRGDFGMVLLAHQFDAAAADAFQTAAELNPADFRWKYLQGLSETAQSRETAMQCFRAAAELNPSNWLPRLRLAELLLAENRPDEAALLIASARTLAPGEIRPALAEIRLLVMRKRFSEADTAATQLQERGVVVRDLVELRAQCLFQLDRPAEAQRLARELQQESLPAAGWNDPYAAAALAFSTDPADLITESRSLAAFGNFRQAVWMLQAQRARAVLHPDFFPVLARLLLESGQPTAALQECDEGLRRTPNSSMLHHLRGSAMFLVDRNTEAIASFRRALELKPDLALAGFNLAHCLLQTGDRSSAITTLMDTLQSAPEMSAARLMLAGLLLDESREQDAAEQLRILEQLLPATDESLLKLKRRMNQ
ncbi:MAG: tetratricopeptide repeat protein [Planctomycetia bacterium]